MSILLPMLAQIGWTFLLYVWLTIARQRAAMRFDRLMFSLELALLRARSAPPLEPSRAIRRQIAPLPLPSACVMSGATRP